MNVKNAAIIAALVSAAILAHGVNANPKPVPLPASSTASTPWVAAEKDVYGDWMDRDSTYWQIQFGPNHALTAYHGDFAGLGPYISTWKLVNNHVIVSDSVALRKQGFFDDWGNDLIVMKFKNHIVLLPIENLPLVERYGLASPLCLWRSTKSGVDNLVDKTIDTRKVMEQLLERDQSKQKQDGK